MKMICILLSLLISLTAFSQTSPESADAKLTKDIPLLMKEANLPGFAIALIRNNKIAWTNYFGYANAKDKTPVTANSVFEAASLTKVVTAYAFLKLVDQGKISLDVPLTQYIGNNYDAGDDARIQKITARMVLSHTSPVFLTGVAIRNYCLLNSRPEKNSATPVRGLFTSHAWQKK